MKLVETFSVAPHSITRILKLSEETQQIKLDNGSVARCVGAYTFPISVPGVENLNHRVYEHKLFERVIAEKQGEGRFGLCDHASDNSPQPDGSTKDAFCVWRNLRFSEDRKLILADCYLFGTWGQHFQDAMDASGLPGFSMVGFGDFLKDGKTIDPDSYILDHPADWVLNPSAQVFGSIDDAIYPKNEKIEAVKLPLQENIEMSTKMEQLQENTFRKQVSFLRKQVDTLPLGGQVQEYTNLLNYFEDGQAVDLKAELVAHLATLVEKANAKPKTTTKKKPENDEDGAQDENPIDSVEVDADDEKEEGGGIANFGNKKAPPFKKKKDAEDHEEPDGDEGDEPEEPSDNDGDEEDELEEKKPDHWNGQKRKPKSTKMKKDSEEDGDEDEDEAKKELVALQTRFEAMADMCESLRDYATKIGQLYEASKADPETTVSMDEYQEVLEAVKQLEADNTALKTRIKKLKKKDQQFNYQHNGDDPTNLDDPDSLSLPLLTGTHDAGDDNDDLDSDDDFEEAVNGGVDGQTRGAGDDPEDELIEPLTHWLPQISAYYEDMRRINPRMELIKEMIGDCRTVLQAQKVCLRMKDIIEPGLTMNREARRGITGTTAVSPPRSFAEAKSYSEEHRLPRRKGWN